MTRTMVRPIADTGRRSADLSADRVSAAFLDAIPRDFAREHLIVSQGRACGVEHLAASDTTDPMALFNVGVRLRAPVRSVVADGETIAQLIDEVYGGAEPAVGDAEPMIGETAEQEIERLLRAADRDLLLTQGKAPVVKLVDGLIFEALGQRASDIHVQPVEDHSLVRSRVDGVLHTVRELPPRLAAAVISRVKVMGRMDIAERRMPQDGRATVTIGGGDRGRSIDLRISTLPTSYGERAVIRLLDHHDRMGSFEELGMPEAVAEGYLARARGLGGIILVTGPTGSGKTTTLYATLRRIGSSQMNIMTIEDPIEYELSTNGLAISQSQVNPRKGITFATGLRNILRQDPDVVMVGEIRDAETARIAIQSSLTGHLVFSTLHTTDAASAITRLLDLGVEPYLVASSLSAVLAQRLVRRLHPPCQGTGCPDCFRTGYLGRTGVFELLVVTDAMGELITGGSRVAEIRRAAQVAGMRTLAAEGHRLVEDGTTSRSEVQRVVEAEP